MLYASALSISEFYPEAEYMNSVFIFVTGYSLNLFTFPRHRYACSTTAPALFYLLRPCSRGGIRAFQRQKALNDPNAVHYCALFPALVALIAAVWELGLRPQTTRLDSASKRPCSTTAPALFYLLHPCSRRLRKKGVNSAPAWVD